MKDELAWVGHFFDRMSLVESNFNTRFDRVDARLDHFDQRMDQLEFDIYYLYNHHNLQPSLPPQDHQDHGDDQDDAPQA